MLIICTIYIYKIYIFVCDGAITTAITLVCWCRKITLFGEVFLSLGFDVQSQLPHNHTLLRKSLHSYAVYNKLHSSITQLCMLYTHLVYYYMQHFTRAHKKSWNIVITIIFSISISRPLTTISLWLCSQCLCSAVHRAQIIFILQRYSMWWRYTAQLFARTAVCRSSNNTYLESWQIGQITEHAPQIGIANWPKGNWKIEWRQVLMASKLFFNR